MQTKLRRQRCSRIKPISSSQPYMLWSWCLGARYRKNNFSCVSCTRLWSNLWCSEGRPNQFLKIGVSKEAQSIITNLSAAIICLFLSLSPIHYLHFRTGVPFLYRAVFVHLSFPPRLLLLCDGFWLISRRWVPRVFPCFSNNRPDIINPEREPGGGGGFCISALYIQTLARVALRMHA